MNESAVHFAVKQKQHSMHPAQTPDRGGTVGYVAVKDLNCRAQRAPWAVTVTGPARCKHLLPARPAFGDSAAGEGRKPRVEQPHSWPNCVLGS